MTNERTLAQSVAPERVERVGIKEARRMVRECGDLCQLVGDDGSSSLLVMIHGETIMLPGYKLGGRGGVVRNPEGGR